MRFNVAGFKFGHVPGTTPSATERARAGNGAPALPPPGPRPEPRASRADALPPPPPRPRDASVASAQGSDSTIRSRSQSSDSDVSNMTFDSDIAADGRAGSPSDPSRSDSSSGSASPVLAPAAAAAETPHAARPSDALARQLDSHSREQYARFGLEISPNTFPQFTDTDVMSEPEELGSGALNTVFAVRMRDVDGTEFAGVFKPLHSVKNGRDNPQIAMRNIATKKCAEALGFDVVVQADMALLTLPQRGTEPATPELGLLMRHAEGQPAARTLPDVMRQPGVVREVTKLQLLDCLTGELERHAANYFVNIDAGGHAHVAGIDNDTCFAVELIGHQGIPVPLPEVVDLEMAAAIENLTPERLTGELAGRLNAADTRGVMGRLAELKAHISELRQGGNVIRPDQWNDPGVLRGLASSNGYVVRDYFEAFSLPGAPDRRVSWGDAHR